MATKNVNVKKGNSTSVEMTPDQVREFTKCAKNPIHFIQNYVYVRHPVKGQTLFNLYDYQVELINAYHNNKDVITLFPRQSGKCCEVSTQLTTLQTKHISTFRKFILKLFFKQVYNQLWPTTTKIQKSYNRTSNLFNKLSATLLNWCLYPTQQSMGELWSNQSQYPVDIIDSTTGELKFTEQSAPTDLFVLTPTGFQPVKHIHKTIPYDVWELCVQDCEPLLCADTHIVLNADGIERYVKDLQVGELINTQFGSKPVISCGLSTLPSSTMFDLELADANHVYYTNNILSHNSETSCAYLFWFSIFNKDKTVLITSNKHKNSSEMISRIKYMYESLPDFLKPGVTDDGWNKLSLKFETGSRIISDATSETTGRGGSFSILYCLGGETTVTVRNKKTGEVSVVSLQDLYHTTSDSRRDAFNTNENYEILTPHSWVDFTGILQTQNKELFRISLSDDTHIDATPEHSFFSNGERIQTQMLQVGQHIDTTAAQISIKSIQSIGKAAVYDIVEVKNRDHSFLVNGNIVTKNCDETAFVRPTIQQEMWASISPTLATGGKLFMTSTPNGDSDLFATLWRGAVAGTNGMKPLTIKWNQVPGRTEAFKKQEIAKNGELKWRQEFECCQGDSMVHIQDKHGNIFAISVENLYLMLEQHGYTT